MGKNVFSPAEGGGAEEDDQDELFSPAPALENDEDDLRSSRPSTSTRPLDAGFDSVLEQQLQSSNCNSNSSSQQFRPAPAASRSSSPSQCDSRKSRTTRRDSVVVVGPGGQLLRPLRAADLEELD